MRKFIHRVICFFFHQEKWRIYQFNKNGRHDWQCDECGECWKDQ